MRRLLLLAAPILFLAMVLVACKGERHGRDLRASVPPKIRLSESERKFDKDIARFEQMERDSPSAKGGIVFTGSSSIRLWDSLQADMAPLPVVNRGFGGSIIRQVSYYADRILIPLQPKLIVLYCGENDICNETSSHEEPVRNFQDFTAIVHHYLPETRILYLNMKPSPLRWQYWDKFQKGNRLIATYCLGDPRLDYLDISAGMLRDDGRTRPEIWKADSLHMNALGYRGWAETVRPEVERIWAEIHAPAPNGQRRRAEPRKEPGKE